MRFNRNARLMARLAAIHTTARYGTLSSSSPPLRIPTQEPSILLQHIHCSLPTVAQMYRERQGVTMGNTTTAWTSPTTAAATGIPAGDPQTDAEGEKALCAFCRELGMGYSAVQRWHSSLRAAFDKQWHGAAAAAAANPLEVTPRVSLGALMTPHRSTPFLSGNTDAVLAAVGTPLDRVYFLPRPQDGAFIRSCVKGMSAVVSPFLTLSPPPSSSPSGARTLAGSLPSTDATSSRFYATRAIPAGMIVLSLPSEAAVLAQPPPASDPLLAYFMHIEDIIGQLIATEEEGCGMEEGCTEGPPLAGYVRYLKASVVPAKNLPFYAESELKALLTRAKDGTEDPKAVSSHEDSPAWQLWRFFTQEMGATPLSGFLRDRLTPDEYAWWVSLILSRRAGASTLIPLVDKLNHSFLPNCHYTMSSPQSFCCLDVLDNIMAGVDAKLLYQPYVHVFTIADVQPGEELCLSYTAPADGLYRRAAGYEAEPAKMGEAVRRTQLVPAWAPSARAAVADLFAGGLGSSSSSCGGGHSVLSRLLHPGRQQVDTIEGRAAWHLQWGFVPPYDSVYSAADLDQIASLAAEKRLDERTLNFPPEEPRY